MDDIVGLIEILETIVMFCLDMYWVFIIALAIFGVIGELTGASSFIPYNSPYSIEEDEDKL